MFSVGTVSPSVFEKQSFDHNFDGLERYHSRLDSYYDSHAVEANGYALLDEISTGESLMDQLRECTMAQLDGEGRRGSEESYRRTTMERRRSRSAGTVVIDRRAVSEGGGANYPPISTWKHDTATPTPGVLNPKHEKGKKPTIPCQDVSAKTKPSTNRCVTAPLLSTIPTYEHRSFDGNDDISARADIPLELLYNWFLLRHDNIKILSSDSQTGDDFPLLKLLASTHETKRWWTINVEDLACPQCVDVLGKKRTDAKVRYLATRPGKTWADGEERIKVGCWGRCRGLGRKCHGGTHCDGGRCRVVCQHRDKDANNVTQFFSKLGPSTAARMRNILLETAEDEIPSIDHLVSCIQNVRYYFPDVQNIEICFHFGKQELNKDTWTRLLCCLVNLEDLLPSGAHLRVKGIEHHTELCCGWGRKRRKWYHGRERNFSFGNREKRGKGGKEGEIHGRGRDIRNGVA